MNQNQNAKPPQTKPGYYNQNDEEQTTKPQEDQNWPHRGNQQEDGEDKPSPDSAARTDKPRREDDAPLD